MIKSYSASAIARAANCCSPTSAFSMILVSTLLRRSLVQVIPRAAESKKDLSPRRPITSATL